MLIDSSGGTPRCAACRYDLSGHGQRGVCPECGARFSARVTLLPAVPRRERARSLWWWSVLGEWWRGSSAAIALLLLAGVIVFIGWRLWTDRLRAWSQGSSAGFASVE